VNIVLFGPPGAGKGTQADNLVKEFNLFKVSTGDLLRNEIQTDSSLGEKIKKTIEGGSLVSDQIINNLIENLVADKKYFNRLIFDGIPRNLNQVKSLEVLLKKYNQKISCVLSLKVDKKNILKRILGRQLCSKCGGIFNEFYNPSNKENHECGDSFLEKRSDDNERTIENRFKTYHEVTLPILDYYQNQKLLTEIDGMKKIDDIYKEIREIIRSL